MAQATGAGQRGQLVRRIPYLSGAADMVGELRDVGDQISDPARRRLLWLKIKEQGFFLSLVLPSVALVTIFLIYPLWRMFSLSFGSLEDGVAFNYNFETFDQYARATVGVGDSKPDVYIELFKTTFQISFLTTVFSIALGYPVAYLLANVADKTRAILLPLVVVPFWTSILVRTFAWRIILGRNGFINETLDWIGIRDGVGEILQWGGEVLEMRPFRWLLDWTGLPDAFNFAGWDHSVDGSGGELELVFNRIGTLIGMVHILVPFMIFPIFAVMRGIPNEYLRAAENLGAGPFTAFRRVYFPLTLPGLGAGILLVFILSLGFFITPALLGGPGDRMISNMIEIQINEVNNWEFAAALAFMLLGGTLVLYFIYARFLSMDRLYGEMR
jgi:ABC-type spermidine/putrescine transport system permease subunit I